MKHLLLIMTVLLLFVSACDANENSSENNPVKNEDIDKSDDLDGSNYRVIATTVAITEIMDALEIDLVGVPTSYKELPKRYIAATEVGMASEPDMEIIRSLNPTDVLSATTLDTEYDLESLYKNANVPVTFVNMESVEGMYEGILQLGEKYDRSKQAERIVKDFEEKLIKTELITSQEDPPTVLILLGIPGSYLVATEHSYIGDLVKRAGGINAIQGEETEYISSNTENLQQANPDIILRAAHGLPTQVVEMFTKEFKENDIWQHFKAVESGRVYDLEETRFGTTANLAAAEALEELADILYVK